MGNRKMKKFFATMMIAAMLCPSMVYADTLEEIPVDGDYYSEEPEADDSYEEYYEPDTEEGSIITHDGEKLSVSLGTENISAPFAPTNSEEDRNKPWLGSFVYYGKVTVSSPDGQGTTDVPTRYRVLSPYVTNLKTDYYQTDAQRRSGMFLDCDDVIDSINRDQIEVENRLEKWNLNFKENSFDTREKAAINGNLFWIGNEVVNGNKSYGYPETGNSSVHTKQRIKYQINDPEKNDGKFWWLHNVSGSSGPDRFLINNNGIFTNSNGSNIACYTSPALILDPKLIVFSSEILPETPPATPSAYGKEYKLTVLDSNIDTTNIVIGSAVSREKVVGEKKETVVTIPCKNIPKGVRVSVVLTDRTFDGNGWSAKPNDSQLDDFYAILNEKYEFTLPEAYENLAWGTKYNVYLFAEVVNEVKETDYASDPIDLNGNVPTMLYSVTVEDDGNGTATASKAEAAKDEPVELIATPNSNYEFNSWKIDAGGVQFDTTKNPVTFKMGTSVVKVTATFKKKTTPVTTTYTITALNDGNGTATASPVKAATGQNVTLTATPKNSDYRFNAWIINKGGVKFDTSKNPVTFKMGSSDVEVKATFEKISKPGPTPASTHTITMLATSKKGKASASVKSAVKGKTVNIAVTSKKGYTFKEWRVISGGVKLKNAKSAKTSFTMGDKNVKIKAYFYKASFKLNSSKLVVEKGKTNSDVKATLKHDELKSAVSSNKNVATAKIVGKKLQIKGKKAGKAKITVKTKSGLKRVLNVTVQADKVTTTKLKLSKTKVSVGKNKYKTVKVTATPNYFSTGENIKVKSSDKKIAKCTFNKTTNKIKITGKKKGNCEITVTAGKMTKTITVTVK